MTGRRGIAGVLVNRRGGRGGGETQGKKRGRGGGCGGATRRRRKTVAKSKASQRGKWDGRVRALFLPANAS